MTGHRDNPAPAVGEQPHDGEGGSLLRRTVSGGVWVLLSMGVESLTSLIQTAIMARLLLPSDFGVWRTAGFVIAAVLVFTDMGLRSALIQRRELDEDTINTAWCLQIIREALLFVVIFAAAPLVARFYDNNPLISPILRLVALRFLLGGFRNIGIVLMQKEMNFRRLQIYESLTLVLAVGVTIVCGFVLRSVWALAYGQVSLTVLRLVGSYYVHPYRPRLVMRWPAVRALLGFGLNLTVSGVLIFIVTQGDDALVGKMLGMKMLGFYALAYSLSNLPATSITQVISNVTLPAYAKLSHDLEHLRAAFRRTLRSAGLLIVPLSVVLAVLAEPIIHVVYGPTYLPCVPAFRVLCLFGLTRAVNGCFGSLMLAVGRPRAMLYAAAAQILAFLVALYPVTAAYGIVGTSVVVTASNLLGGAIYVGMAARHVGLKPVAALSPLSLSLLASICMGIVLYGGGATEITRSNVSLQHVGVVMLAGVEYVAIIGLSRTVRREVQQVFAALVGRVA